MKARAGIERKTVPQNLETSLNKGEFLTCCKFIVSKGRGEMSFLSNNDEFCLKGGITMIWDSGEY